MSKGENIRVAGYIRVSDESQIEGHSLDAQQNEITRWCERRNYDLLSIYAEEGRSAHTENIDRRPRLVELLHDADKGMFDVVVVHNIDRWSRNVGVQRQALQRLGEAGVGFASVAEDMDYTTPWGRLSLTMMGSVAEFFSDQLGFHVSKAQRHRVEMGLPVGPIPFGYAHTSPDKPPAIIEEEAEAISEAFRRKSGGNSNGSIADWLNSIGLETRTGRRFTAYAVRDMLTTRFYTGVILYKGKEYPGLHEAIVADELYQQVNMRRAHRGRRSVLKGVTGALQGLVSCGHCGNNIHSERNYRLEPRYRERHGWECATNGGSVVAHRLDWQIAEIMACIELKPSWRDEIIRLTVNRKNRVDLESLQVLKRRIARAYGDGAYTDAEYARKLADIDGKIQSAVPVNMPTLDETAELLDDFPSIWSEALPEERRQLVAPLIERVYVDLKEKRITAIRPKPAFQELLAHAINSSRHTKCTLLSSDSIHLKNVGLVETGEGRTPRPEDNPREHIMALARYLFVKSCRISVMFQVSDGNQFDTFTFTT